MFRIGKKADGTFRLFLATGEALDKPQQFLGTSIVVKDKAGNQRRVMTEKSGLYNLMAREYTYQTSDKSKATIIHNSSSAVVHLIDGPLMIEN